MTSIKHLSLPRPAPIQYLGAPQLHVLGEQLHDQLLEGLEQHRLWLRLV